MGALSQQFAFLVPEDDVHESVQAQAKVQVEIQEITKPVIASQAWLEPQSSQLTMFQPEKNANFANGLQSWSYEETVEAEVEKESWDRVYHYWQAYGDLSSAAAPSEDRAIYDCFDADFLKRDRTPLNTSAFAWLGQAPISVPMDWSAPAKSVAKKKKKKQKSSVLTTMMMRGLPSDYSRNMLIELLDLHHFKGLYDLVYLPVDFQCMQGFGYAFVNFISQEHAERFQAHFTGFSDWPTPSDLVAEVAWGTSFQGLEKHVVRYRNSPVMHASVPDSFKPALFSQGVRIAFPKPSLPPKAPRSRRTRSGPTAASEIPAPGESGRQGV